MTDHVPAIERLADVEAVLRVGAGGIRRDTDYARRVAADIRKALDLIRVLESPKSEQPWVAELEGLREKVLDELDRAWLHGRWDHPWDRGKAADAILDLIQKD